MNPRDQELTTPWSWCFKALVDSPAHLYSVHHLIKQLIKGQGRANNTLNYLKKACCLVNSSLC